MVIEVQSDSALMLKKRARRRLVGSIALVLMMLMILPQVLQNREDASNPEAVAITMVDRQQAGNADQLKSEIENKPNQVQLSEVAIDPLVQPETTLSEDNVMSDESENVEVIADEVVVEVPEPVVAVAQKPLSKNEPTKNIETIKSETVDALPKTSNQNNAAKYLIQVGVFAEQSNVKRLQAKISLAGLSSYTAEVNSSQGKMYRLRVGSFVTREAAANALKKLQADGISGMVMTDD